ncbi:MAG: hypothetical protein QM658_04855 [Gordonia sp. (in: high G+C Gram-positive bacteria)]
MTATTRAQTRLLPLILALGTALSAAACSSGDAPKAEGPCATSSSAGASGVRPIDLPNPEVTVTDPGTGALRVPASAPDVTSPQQVTLKTDSTETSIAPTDGQQTDVPAVQTIAQTVTIPLTARAGCTDPKNLEYTMGTPTTPDKALSPQLKEMGGSTGGVSYLAGLAPTSLRILPRDAASSPARSAVEQSMIGAFTHSVPVPTTPVGVGARWRSVRTVTAATTVTQTLDVTLKEWKGDVLTLDVTVDEVPVNAVFQIPGSADTLHVNRYSMSGKGTVTVDLRRLLPTGGSLSINGARELVGSDANKPILQRTGLTVEWSATK